jgi:hypothetical protein
MKWPKSVEIGGLKYRIKYVTPGKIHPIDGYKMLEKEESGAITQATREIFIDKTLDPEVRLLVLFHEVFHGLGDVFRPNGPPFNREEFTNVVSNIVMQALKSMGMLPKLS